MAEEVRIRVTEERTGTALADAQRKMEELKTKIAEFNRLESTYTEKGLPEAARTVRQDRIPARRELRELERQITGEQREQSAIAQAQQAGIARQQRLQATYGRLALAGAGTLLGLAGTATGEYSEWQGVANRERSQREIETRERELRGARGFSEAGAIGAVRGTEDRMFQRQAERPDLERKVVSDTVTGTLQGIAAGAASGFFLGGIPGAIAGGVGGGAIGGLRGYSNGRRALRESDNAQARDVSNLEKDKADQRYFYRQETGREIEIAEKVAAGEMAAARAAEMRLKYHRDIEALKAKGADFEDATRGADANFRADLRQREQSMGSLITARTGASAAARIAVLAGRQREQMWGQVIAQKLDEQNRAYANAKSPKLQRLAASPPLRE